jgi:carbon-monoxide dehydrogenase medium subunit
VKPARFRYHAPERLDEALALLSELGDDAILLAGGQSLVPMMNLRLVQAPDVIDLNEIADLRYMRRENGHLEIGAMTRQRALERSHEIASAAPLLAEAVPHIAYPAVRARGTIGGSVAHADPAAELTCALLAADATVVLASRAGRREISVSEFTLGPYFNARASDELVVAIRVPVGTTGQASAFAEFARKKGDFALALAGVSLALRNGRCEGVRIAVGGAGPTPVRVASAERVLEGSEVALPALVEAAEAAGRDVTPTGDAHGSAAYRRRVVTVQVRRALERAVSRGAAAAPIEGPNG